MLLRLALFEAAYSLVQLVDSALLAQLDASNAADFRVERFVVAQEICDLVLNPCDSINQPLDSLLHGGGLAGHEFQHVIEPPLHTFKALFQLLERRLQLLVSHCFL
jgi:hypothetical protein